MTDVRASQVALEIISNTVPVIRSSQTALEIIHNTIPVRRASQTALEVIHNTVPVRRVSQTAMEILVSTVERVLTINNATQDHKADNLTISDSRIPNFSGSPCERIFVVP